MILDEIITATVRRLNDKKTSTPLENLKESVKQMEKGDFPFKKAIQKKGMSFICEVKKASPSKGVIDTSKVFDFLGIAQEYKEAGADCISVLTEPDFFQGNDRFLYIISRKTGLPTLRKDFTIDEYMVYEAKYYEASCVLLICSLFSTPSLERYLRLCNDLGLSAICEAHDEKEIDRALSAGADIIGVNNRDLNTFTVDINNSLRLRERVGDKALFIAESGINTRGDIKTLEDAGVDGVLIGETLMRSADKKMKLMELKGTV